MHFILIWHFLENNTPSCQFVTLRWHNCSQKQSRAIIPFRGKKKFRPGIWCILISHYPHYLNECLCSQRQVLYTHRFNIMQHYSALKCTHTCSNTWRNIGDGERYTHIISAAWRVALCDFPSWVGSSKSFTRLQSQLGAPHALTHSWDSWCSSCKLIWFQTDSLYSAMWLYEVLSYSLALVYGGVTMWKKETQDNGWTSCVS